MVKYTLLGFSVDMTMPTPHSCLGHVYNTSPIPFYTLNMAQFKVNVVNMCVCVANDAWSIMYLRIN